MENPRWNHTTLVHSPNKRTRTTHCPSCRNVMPPPTTNPSPLVQKDLLHLQPHRLVLRSYPSRGYPQHCRFVFFDPTRDLKLPLTCGPKIHSTSWNICISRHTKRKGEPSNIDMRFMKKPSYSRPNIAHVSSATCAVDMIAVTWHLRPTLVRHPSRIRTICATCHRNIPP